MAWSYNLLEVHEARLFAQLAVFVGGWTFSAAEAVCGCEDDSVLIADVLEALTTKSLLRVHTSPEGESRFTMLQTIHEYAAEQLTASGQEPELLARHAEFFAQFAEAAEPHLRSGSRDPYLAQLQLEIDNLRAVLKRAQQRQINLRYGFRLAGTLGWFWHLRGHLSEGRGWATALLALPEAGERGRLRAKLLFPAGGLAWSQGDYETARRYLEESAAIFEEVDDLHGLTDARGILAGSLAGLGAYAQARGV